MHCINCGQDLPEGASICPSCGAPVIAAPAPQVSPTPYAPPVAVPTLPGASGLSIASLVLGILGIVLVILAIALSYNFGANIVRQFGETMEISQEEISRLAEDPTFQSSVLGILISFSGAMLSALVGFILGVVSIVQEGQRPTQSGKALGISGLALSALPLLCCVSVLIIGLLAG